MEFTICVDTFVYNNIYDAVIGPILEVDGWNNIYVLGVFQDPLHTQYKNTTR